MKHFKILILSCCLLISGFLLFGCAGEEGGNKDDVETVPEPAISYSITYHLDGGFLEELNPSSYKNIDDLKDIKNPTKQNNEFLGWYLDSDFETSLNDLSSSPNKNIELFAKWMWYDLNSSQDMLNIKVNCNYRLTNNIDMSGIYNYNPIGNTANPFVGIFDGQGYKISNLTITKNNEGEIGLFGAVKNANIKNLALNAISLINNGADNAGVLAGYSSYSQYERLSLRDININVSNTSSSSVGGLIGNSYNDNLYKCAITGHNNTLKYTNSYSGYSEVGGFIGNSNSTLKVCYSIVDVVCDGGDSNNCDFRVGNFIGVNDSNGNINQVFSVGSSNTATCAYATTGGFVGINRGIILNFYTDSYPHVYSSNHGGYNVKSGVVIGSQLGVVGNGYRYAVIDTTYPYAKNIDDISILWDKNYMIETMKFNDPSWKFLENYYPYF